MTQNSLNNCRLQRKKPFLPAPMFAVMSCELILCVTSFKALTISPHAGCFSVCSMCSL
jgi:hypothetical protein